MDHMPGEVALTDREKALWLAFIETTALLVRRLDQLLRTEHGLTHIQYEILVRLSFAPCGRLRMSELADQAVSTKSGLTYQLTQLEKLGLARRQSCAGDERGVFAQLTEAGREMLRRAVPAHEAAVREHLLDHLTPEQADALVAAMCATRRHLRGCAEACDAPESGRDT
jgi:DNA-binding MarR family transcriptional regulator